MASGQAKRGKEKTEERGEWAGQVRSSISFLGAQEKSPCSEQLQLRLIPARSRTATPSTVASPSSPRCVCACCASLLPCFSHITAGFAPPPLPAVALFACSIPPLTAAPTEWSPTGWQSFTPAFLHCRSSQNIDKTQMVRSTAASDRASSGTPAHHGGSQLHLHTRGSRHGAGSMLGAPRKRCRGCSCCWLTADLCSLPCSHIRRARLTRCFTWSQRACLLQPTVFLHVLLCCSHQCLLCCCPL